MFAGGRIFSIVGARPQFVKLAPVSRAWKTMNVPVDDVILHTGQHYDDSMSSVFFDELDIPVPNINLNVGSGSHGAQTGAMLAAIEAALLEFSPDAVVVYGDTNSTIAGTLAATKLNLPVVHIEAGLRSFNRAMPEEVNRIATDHLSDLLLAPTPTAMHNLEVEGLISRAVNTGDVMFDAVLHNSKIAADKSTILGRLQIERRRYGVVTAHRAENTEPAHLNRLLAGLNAVAERFAPLIFPMHPRTRAAIGECMPDWRPCDRLQIVEPLGYLDMLALVESSRWVLTDSGGLQKEAMFLGRPCVTLRNETEWLETVEMNANILAGCDPQKMTEAVAHWESQLGGLSEGFGIDGSNSFGDGRAAEKIVMQIASVLEAQGAAA